jgi:hypothetical protein
MFAARGERLEPAKEWQRLTRLYSEKGDEELQALSYESGDLTDIAQQVLRDELKRRSLPEPEAAISAASAEGGKRSEIRDDSFDDSIDNPMLSEETEEEQGDEPPSGYTWKVVLCECNAREDAADVMAMLEQAGIRSWYEGQDGATSWASYGSRVLIAADDVKRAQAVMQKPIPQEIRDQNRTKVPDFVAPNCSQCGDLDPLLVSVEPSNTWLCEVCGHRWSEPVASQDRPDE